MKKVIINIFLIALVTGISCKKVNIVSPKPVTLIVTDTTAYYSDDDLSIPYEINYDSDTYSRIVKPVVITEVSPKYPEEAGIHGWHGDVFVYALVMNTGIVKRCHIYYSVDNVFNKPSLTATMAWIFKPATLDGNAINIWIGIHYHFLLSRQESISNKYSSSIYFNSVESEYPISIKKSLLENR